jgi:hypothetical protein
MRRCFRGIFGPVRKVPPKERCNLGRFGVVVGDGVDGVHGGGWAGNRDDRKSELLFFSRFWTRNRATPQTADRHFRNQQLVSDWGEIGHRIGETLTACH